MFGFVDGMISGWFHFLFADALATARRFSASAAPPPLCRANSAVSESPDARASPMDAEASWVSCGMGGCVVGRAEVCSSATVADPFVATRALSAGGTAESRIVSPKSCQRKMAVDVKVCNHEPDSAAIAPAAVERKPRAEVVGYALGGCGSRGGLTEQPMKASQESRVALDVMRERRVGILDYAMVPNGRVANDKDWGEAHAPGEVTGHRRRFVEMCSGGVASVARTRCADMGSRAGRAAALGTEVCHVCGIQVVCAW